MGIKFDCKHCGQSLHVKDHLAGKRGICPHCQGKIEIPSVSEEGGGDAGTATASVELRTAVVGTAAPQAAQPAVTTVHVGAATVPTNGAQAVSAKSPEGVSDAIAEGPHLQWYVLPPGSITKYGPAAGDMMRNWVAEGRVPADSLVWREGWPQWRPAAEVFPQLRQALLPQAPATMVGATPAAPEAVATEPIAAVEIGVFSPEPISHVRPGRAKAKTARSQRSVIVGVLVTLFVLFLAALIYVLLNQ